MIRVVLFAPIFNSLYARLVTFGLAKEHDVVLSGIVVRSHLDFQRLKTEFTRDRSRLLNKIIEKWIRADKRFLMEKSENLGTLADHWNIPDGTLKQQASRFQIPYRVVRDFNHIDCLNFVQPAQPDLVVFTGGGLIKEKTLQIPRIGILNCHTGILPRFRGMDVVEWTAAESEIHNTGFGVSLHLMNKGVDTGPILLKRKVEISRTDNFSVIRKKLETEMVIMMLEGVRGFRDHTMQLIQQKVDEGRQYYVMHPRMKEFSERKLRNATSAN